MTDFYIENLIRKLLLPAPHDDMKKKNNLFVFLLFLIAILFTPLNSYGEDADSNKPIQEAQEVVQEKSPPPLSMFNAMAAKVLFFDVSFKTIEIDEVNRVGQTVLDETGAVKKRIVEIPFIVVFLLLGGIFFTFRFNWINFRAFRHAIDVVKGKFDRHDHPGEVSHFQALTSALSATVGLGNIAGVAVAIYAGGPGAVFWMLVTALFGMSSKFASSTLSQLYRQQNADGSVSGGPMYYLDYGIKSLGKNFAPIGKVLAVIYAIMIMAAAIGGGNMFQANQTTAVFTETFALGGGGKIVFGILMAMFVGLVVLGGIRRIGTTTSRIVPLMVIIYIATSLYIILVNITKVPETLSLIVEMAFTKNAFFGGMAGVLIQGIRRAAFSNEAGLGSAAIAHAAAKTDEPVREGLVAMLGPFIDTIIVCLMTAIVIIITGTWNNPNIDVNGVVLTTTAFKSVLPWFPYILTICIGLFAYSTMIAWCYYGEKGWIYLFDHFNEIGVKTVFLYRIIFVAFVFLGSIWEFKDVLDFSDLMMLSLAFPNILGIVFLSGKVKSKLEDYMKSSKKWGDVISL